MLRRSAVKSNIIVYENMFYRLLLFSETFCRQAAQFKHTKRSLAGVTGTSSNSFAKTADTCWPLRSLHDSDVLLYVLLAFLTSTMNARPHVAPDILER
jgi:hypothetical protein